MRCLLESEVGNELCFADRGFVGMKDIKAWIELSAIEFNLRFFGRGFRLCESESLWSQICSVISNSLDQEVGK